MNAIKTLVLGGGGLAGLGWLAGLLLGLKESGIDLRDADQVIGTSAGAATAAQLRSAQSIEMLYARQTEPALIADEAPPSMRQLAELMNVFPKLMAITDSGERMRAIGWVAKRTKSVAPQVRRAMIEKRLTDHSWPVAALTITAVDAESGALVTFDSNSGLELVDAVAASCAAPGVWPVVEIDGRSFIDGGVFSSDNAQLASGSQCVLIVSPMGNVATFPQGFRLSDQVAALAGTGAKVLAIEPNSEARTAMGTNPFDPGTRIPSAWAGRTQGKAVAQEVADFWT